MAVVLSWPWGVPAWVRGRPDLPRCAEAASGDVMVDGVFLAKGATARSLVAVQLCAGMAFRLLEGATADAGMALGLLERVAAHRCGRRRIWAGRRGCSRGVDPGVVAESAQCVVATPGELAGDRQRRALGA